MFNTRNKLIISLLLGAVFIVFPCQAQALDTCATGWKVNNGATVTVDCPAECKKVVNACGSAIFVPTKTAAEWLTFKNNLPAGVTLATCCSAQGVACAVDGDCCSTFCRDGYCCDTTCGNTCRACDVSGPFESVGECTNIPNSTDPDNECPELNCTTKIKGWNGNICQKYTGDSGIDGTCESGACVFCTGATKSGSAECGDSECKNTCPEGGAATDYDTIAEVCHTDLAQHDCEICDNTLVQNRHCTGSTIYVGPSAPGNPAACASWCSANDDGSTNCCEFNFSTGSCNLNAAVYNYVADANKWASPCNAGAWVCGTAGSCAVANGTKCEAPSECASGHCWGDDDEDGFNGSAGNGECNAAASPGTDCCDSDADVYPGQTAYFTSATNCGGYDYNCSSSEEPEPEKCYNCTNCTVSGTCNMGGCGPNSASATVTCAFRGCGASGSHNYCKINYSTVWECHTSQTSIYDPIVRDFCGGDSGNYAGADSSAGLDSKSDTCGCR